MSRAVALVVSSLVLSIAVPGIAQANAVIAARYEVDDHEARVFLTAREPVHAPTWRIQRGRIAMWIPGMNEDTRHDPRTDGWAVRRIRVRPGVGDNAVLQIVLRDQRIVPREAVSVEVAGEEVTVRIDRAALPAGPLAAAPEATAEHAGAAIEGAAPSAGENTEENAEASSDASPEASSEGAADEIDEASDEEGDERVAGAEEGAQDVAAATRPSAPRSVASATTNGSNMMILILISAVLGLAYVVIKKVVKRRNLPFPGEEIEVVSTRRIGPRHQIVVVRALGENHLLSIHGTQTTRIASSSADLREPVDLPLADVIRGSDAPPRDEVRNSGFAAELHRLADHRLGNAGKAAKSDASASASDAVAGLVRLRASGGR